MPLIHPPHTHQLNVRSPTSRLGNPTGSNLFIKKRHVLTMEQQIKRRNKPRQKKVSAGIYFDKKQIHKDLATCHRVYRPLRPRPSSAASRTYGQLSPRNTRRQRPRNRSSSKREERIESDTGLNGTPIRCETKK